MYYCAGYKLFSMDTFTCEGMFHMSLRQPLVVLTGMWLVLTGPHRENHMCVCTGFGRHQAAQSCHAAMYVGLQSNS